MKFKLLDSIVLNEEELLNIRGGVSDGISCGNNCGMNCGSNCGNLCGNACSGNGGKATFQTNKPGSLQQSVNG